MPIRILARGYYITVFDAIALISSGSSRVKSWEVVGISFFLIFVLDFAVDSSSPLMANGQTVHRQFIDLQRPSFGFRFSFGESHGFMMTRPRQCLFVFWHGDIT